MYRMRSLHRFKLLLPAKDRHGLRRQHVVSSARRIPVVAQNVYPPKARGGSETREFNIKINRLGRHGQVEEARDLFDKMPQLDSASYATMITVYLKNKDLSKAESLFYVMPGSNIVAESAMINGYVDAGRLRDARKVFDGMRERNVYSWTSLVSGYFRSGDVNEARRLFEEMPVKNEVSWTTVIVGYARNDMIDQAREAFDAMPDKNVIAWTAMIKSYIDSKRLDAAEELFTKMPEKNVYTWNIMISGLMGEPGRTDEAIQLFKSMPQKNEVSWTTMVTGLARNGMTALAREHFNEMPNKDVAAYNAMITAYIDQGSLMEAKELFASMPVRNLVTWNVMLDGLGRSGPPGEVLELLKTMLHSGFAPSEATLTSALTSCRGLPEVMQVHAMVIPRCYAQDVSFTNALISMYSHGGDLKSAMAAFENLQAKDVISWTSMILAYSNHGCGLHALQGFARMLRAGEIPDGITFVGILSACSHAGLVRKGRMLFDSMKIAYGLEPTSEHYSCLVDILGRARQVDEAIEVVSGMPPSKRDGAVLGALLGACRLQGNRDERVVNYIGEMLIEIEPRTAGSYVLLGNAYAASGKWDELARVRKRMKEMNVKKVPGYSQIEVKGENYMFFAGDQSHPEMEEIYAMLRERLVPIMREIG